MSKRIQVKVECWMEVYVDDELTMDEIIDIVSGCDDLSDLENKDGIDYLGEIVGESGVCLNLCKDDDTDSYIWFDTENEIY